MFWIEDEYLVNNMGSTSESLEKFLIKGHTYIRIISKTLSFRSPVISISWKNNILSTDSSDNKLFYKIFQSLVWHISREYKIRLIFYIRIWRSVLD